MVWDWGCTAIGLHLRARAPAVCCRLSSCPSFSFYPRTHLWLTVFVGHLVVVPGKQSTMLTKWVTWVGCQRSRLAKDSRLNEGSRENATQCSRYPRVHRAAFSPMPLSLNGVIWENWEKSHSNTFSEFYGLDKNPRVRKSGWESQYSVSDCVMSQNLWKFEKVI